ncbi:MAG: hypothetical protein LAQ30_10900 [Acidobacteriia bacterium]|nr:hypothetical protein [Terriglobia bacterium]
MESFLNRYRNITVLLLVIFAQLLLIAVQVKSERDIPMIRVWAVSAVTPVARGLEAIRSGSAGLVRNYIVLRNADDENRRLRTELERYKIENIFLKNELNTADRAKALQVLQAHTPSRTLAATVIGTGAGTGSRVLFVDRGSVSGVQRGMAVVTPDGIAGKVIASYPIASEVLLITDPDFAAGVVSQKNQARGTLKGQGTPLCRVDYVPNEEKVELGEWFYTSGEDRIFPRGFPVGVVKSVRNGQPYKEIYLEPSGLRRGVDDVLILIENVHQEIPEAPPANQPVYIAPPPPAPTGPDGAPAAPTAASPKGPETSADKLRTEYQAAAESQKKTLGDGTVKDPRPVDFTKLGQQPPAPGGAPPAVGGRGQGPGNQAPAGNAVPAPQAKKTSEPNAHPPTGGPAPVQAPGPDPQNQRVPRPAPGPAPEQRRANQAVGAPAAAPPPSATGGSPRK